jgi:dTDP-4-dehydrorhamnose 3,5-epimerase
MTSGSIFDIAVDLRWGSPTFGRHVAALLSASDWNQIPIPERFAHGYCPLDPDSEELYKVTAYCSAEHHRGVFWSDSALGIAWPVSMYEILVSERDRDHPVLDGLPRFFVYRPTGTPGAV